MLYLSKITGQWTFKNHNQYIGIDIYCSPQGEHSLTILTKGNESKFFRIYEPIPNPTTLFLHIRVGKDEMPPNERFYLNKISGKGSLPDRFFFGLTDLNSGLAPCTEETEVIPKSTNFHYYSTTNQSTSI